MKKVLFITLLMYLGIHILSAQTSGYLFSEGFANNTLPTGWSAGSGWTFNLGYAHAGTGNTTSLVTPQIQLPANQTMVLGYYVRNASQYSVRISSTNNPNNTLTYIDSSDSSFKYEYIILHAFIGQKITISFTQAYSNSNNIDIDVVTIQYLNQFPDVSFRTDIIETGNGTATIAWSPPQGFFAQRPFIQVGYEYRYGTSPDINLAGNWVRYGYYDHMTPTITVSNLTNSTTYYFFARAFYHDSYHTWDGLYSTPVSISVIPGVFNNPVNVAASPSNGIVNISWSAPYGSTESIIGYKVYRNTSTSDYGSINISGSLSSSTLTYTDYGVSNGTTYYYKVSALYTSKESQYQKTNFVSATPGIYNPPQNVVATAGSARVDLSWSAPSTGNNGTLSGYKVYYGTTNPPTSSVTRTTSQTTYTHTSLSNGTKYYYRVTATYTNNNAESISNVYEAVPRLFNAPGTITVTPNCQQVLISWNAPSTGYTGTLSGYKIYRGEDSNFTPNDDTNLVYTKTTNLTDRTWTDATVSNGTSYYYIIRASYTHTNVSGDSGNSPVSSIATPAHVFNVPRTLVATPSNGQISFTWVAPLTGSCSTLSGYKVYRGTSATSVTTLVHTTANATTLNYTYNIANGTSYYYAVRASYSTTGHVGDSDNSNVYGPIKAYEHRSPQTFTATAGNTQVVLNWTAPATGHGATVSGYKIYRHTVTPYTPSTTYLVQTITNGSIYTWTDTGCANGTDYYYKITATYTDPSGDSSSQDATTYPVKPYVWNAPQTFTATAGNTQVVLNWTAPATGQGATLSGYKIYRHTASSYTPSETYLLQTITSGSIYTWTDTDLENGTDYYYKIVATYTSPTGDSSPINATSYPVKPYVWNPPQSFTATAGNQEAVLNWTTPSTGQGATLSGYKIYRGTTSNFTLGTPLQTIAGTNTFTYTDTGLTNGTDYYYKIVATYTDPTGDSSSINATTYPVKPYEHRPLQTFTATAGNEQVVLNWASPSGHGATVSGYEIYRETTASFVISVTSLHHTVTSGSTLTWTDTESLTNGVDYYYKIVAIYTNPAGSSASINATPYPATPFAICNSPQNLSVTPSNQEAVLTWQTPQAGSSGSLTGFRIYRGTTAIFTLSSENLVRTVSNENTLTWTDTELANGTEYYYKITATYSTTPGESEPINASPYPAKPFVWYPPQSFTITDGFAKATLDWEAPASDHGATLTGYNIYRGTTPDFTKSSASLVNEVASGSILSWENIGLENGTKYYYQIVATYEDPDGESTPISVSVQLKVFNPPTSLVANDGNARVDLSWSAPEEHEHSATLSGYKIFRNNVMLPEGAISNSNLLTFTDYAVNNNTSYEYKVVAVYTDPIGESIASSPITATPFAIFNPPLALSAIVGFNSVALGWSPPATVHNSATLAGYTIKRGEAVLATNLSSDLTQYTDASAQNGEAYTYSVVALYTNPVGNSEPTAINVQMREFNEPRDLVANAGNSLIILSWQEPAVHPHSATLAGYKLYREDLQSPIYEGTNLTHPDNTVVNGVEYSYYVAAFYINPVGYSEPSNIATETPVAVFLPPQNLDAEIGFNSVVLIWSTPETVHNSATLIGYRLVRDSEDILVDNTEETQYIDTTALNGTPYTYSVIALYTNPVGESHPASVSIQMKVFNAPTNLTAESGNSQVALSWQEPNVHDHSAYLVGYRIYRDNVLLENDIITDRNILSLTNENVENGTTYEYYVVACYTEPEGFSVASNVVSATPNAVFNPPTVLTATIGFNSVFLSWSPPDVAHNSATLGGYELYRDEVFLEEFDNVTTEFVDESAENGEVYTYFVTAIYYGPFGESEPTSEDVQLKVFNPPTDLTLTAGNSQIELNWFAPEEHEHAAELTGFQVYRDGVPIPSVANENKNVSSYTDFDVDNGITYEYYVVANYTEPFGVSAPSNTAEAIPAATFNPPVGLSVMVGFEYVELSWEAPATAHNSASLSGYMLVQEDIVVSDELPPEAISWVITDLENGEEYIYSIIAIYTAPEGYSEPICVTAQMRVFNPPTNLVATAGNAQVILNWLAPEEHEHSAELTDFQLFRDGEPIPSVANAKSSGFTYTDTDVENGVAYEYYVVANYTEPFGVSEASDAIMVTPDAVFYAPETLTATIGFNSVTLNWEEPVANLNSATLSSYIISREDVASLWQLDPDCYEFIDDFAQNGEAYTYYATAIYTNPAGISPDTCIIVQMKVFNPPINFNAVASDAQVELSWEEPEANEHSATLTGYNIFRDGDIIHSFIIDEDTSELTFTDIDLENGTEYLYYLVAVYTEPDGYSVASDSIFVTPAPPIIEYGLPLNLTASTNVSSVTLYWQAPEGHLYSPELVGYNVYESDLLINETPIADSTFTHADLEFGTYTYAVSAVYISGESAQTEPITVMIYDIQPPIILPPIPGPQSMVLIWQQPATITGLLHYNIYRRVGVEETFELIQEEVTATLYTDTGLENGATYSYYITAVFENGESNPSNIVSSTLYAVFNPVNNLVATIGFNSVTLGWVAPTANQFLAVLSGYQIIRDEEVLAISNDVLLTSYADSTAVNGQAYTYSVKALYTNGTAESVAVSVSVQMKVFPAPTELEANAGNAQVILYWETPLAHEHSANLVGYSIYRDDMLIDDVDFMDTTYLDEGLVNDVEYAYYVVAVYSDPDGASEPSEVVNATPSLPSNNEDEVISAVTRLSGNYPNPFNPTTTIAYEVASEGYVVIDVFSIKGQRVRSLVNGMHSAGGHKVVWDGHDESGRSVSSGIYFYRMAAGDYVAVRKMVMLK